MIRINDIRDTMVQHNPDSDIELIDRAFILSARCHDGQVRLSGEPYLSHPLEVANILADMGLDDTTIAAALLHDVLEDTDYTIEELRESFGEEITAIVSGVTKLSAMPFFVSEMNRSEHIRQMLLSLSADIRVLIIKLADRLHNMRQLKYHKENERKKIAKETIEVYAPIAEKLGISSFQTELEDLAFQNLSPEDYNKLTKDSSYSIRDTELFIAKITTEIKRGLKVNKINCKIFINFESAYQLYKRGMKESSGIIRNPEVDVFIIVNNISECYSTLGSLHSMMKPIEGKFQDNIYSDKQDLDRGLETMLIGPKGEKIRIKIKTQEMYRLYRYGTIVKLNRSQPWRIDYSIDSLNKMEIDICEDTEELDNLKRIKNKEKIIRSIVFPPEYYQAGMIILNNFSTVLRDRYPNINAGIVIRQEGLKVQMIIETPEGHKELVEDTLNKYALLVKEKIQPENLLEDPIQLMDLKWKLKTAKLMLNNQYELSNLIKSQYSDRINHLEKTVNVLEERVHWFQDHISQLLTHSDKQSEKVKDIAHGALDKISTSSKTILELFLDLQQNYKSVSSELLCILKKIEITDPKKNDKEIVREYLADIKQKEPKVINEILSFIEQFSTSLGGSIWANIITDSIKMLV